MMKNRAPHRPFHATRLDSVLFELFVEGGHETDVRQIYGSVDRDSTE